MTGLSTRVGFDISLNYDPDKKCVVLVVDGRKSGSWEPECGWGHRLSMFGLPDGPQWSYAIPKSERERVTRLAVHTWVDAQETNEAMNQSGNKEE